MLKPAILYAEEIRKKFMEYFYTDDMMYETGSSIGQWIPEIAEDTSDGRFQWAILNSKEKLIGYFDYYIDFYSGAMTRFGLISFDRGNAIIGKDVFNKIEECIKEYHLHRVEWRMVGGNPVERSYDAFLKKHNGRKLILKDVFKDKTGKYHDDVIYEIIIQEDK